MITLLVRIALFASSFAIAFVLAGIRMWGHDAQLACWLFAGAWATIVPACLVVAYSSRAVGFSGTVTSFERRGEAIAGYLVGYVLPVILVDPGDSFDVIAIAVFLVLLSLTYAAADLHYLNPLLPLLGFRVWDVVVQAPDRPHTFTAIGWRVQMELEQSLCVVGDGAVRWVRTTGKDRCG